MLSAFALEDTFDGVDIPMIVLTGEVKLTVR